MSLDSWRAQANQMSRSEFDDDKREFIGQQTSISMFFGRVDMPVFVPIYCVKCGKKFAHVANGEIQIISDGPGPIVESTVGTPIITQHQCNKCKTPYRFYL